MQFEMNHKVGTDYSTVRFAHFDFSPSVKASLLLSFNRIGGKKISDTLWEFPSFITSEVLQETIHNTCFVCGGLMKDGTAFKNEDIIEVPNGLSMTSHVYSNAGEAKQIKVRKCQSCGHSHT